MAARERGTMPLLDHLRELRKRIIRAAFFIFIFSILGFVYYNQIITTLAEPVCDLKLAQSSGSNNCGSLFISGVLGPLNLQVKVAFLTGVIVSAPFWLYQLWAFIAPALHRKERRKSVLFIIAATPFFTLGASLAYYILPIAIRVLFGFTPDSLNNLVRFDDYLSFVLRIILIFGLAFELPVFLVSLNLIGVLSGRGILKPWRFAIFGITVFVAAFSPTADPLSMAALALPLIIFYFGAGGIALLVDKKRDKKSQQIGDNQAADIDQASPIDEPLPE
ncbi:MAG: twin-arginine translocase subunit TatC [Actinobacteria bacterium]|nr:twin-arginine translocase subunit TatC [Actinomycetota bacterium]NCU83897.1 twin-arginine translocase subunit TatC [Actinomycetota bacterium]NDF43330.1 twin-arginine translocase subunit TatC [Actinomycetota bacterium]